MNIKLSVLIFLLFLGGCSTSIHDYSGTSPELKLETFFNGPLKAYGIVVDRNGKVIRRFKVDMVAHWKDNQGILDETFYYDDGEQQKRIWKLIKDSEGNYLGNADDVITTAKGQTSGFALNWTYTLAIDVDDTTWHIDFNDWMYLLDEKRLINRAKMTKWGFQVGEVLLWIEKT